MSGGIRPGVRLGIDVGKARIGVAQCDPHAMLATPIETVPRDPEGVADVARIRAIAAETAPMEVVVGLPLNLRGEHTPSTNDAVDFAHRLARMLAPIPVRLVDERLSTVVAQGQLRQAGKKTRGTRHVVDQAAAVAILQHALEVERGSGREPGQLVDLSGGEEQES